MTNTVKDQQGMTLVELMIATTVFATVLVIVLFGFVFVTKDYVRGYYQSQTQEAARTIISEVSEDIQLNGDTPTVLATKTGMLNGLSIDTHNLCIGDNLYSYTYNNEDNPNLPYIFTVFNDGKSCDASSGQNFGGGTLLADSHHYSQELLGQNMRLGRFSVMPNGPGPYKIIVSVAIGSFNDPNNNVTENDSNTGSYQYQCQDLSFGGEFCAQSTLTTIVQQRQVEPGV
jgi:prepilin-type N-terminal cleavage/methylation domain-containing protein